MLRVTKPMLRALLFAGLASLASQAQTASLTGPVPVAEQPSTSAPEFLRAGPGKYADIIAVDGDVLNDIKQLEHVKFVMKGGEVVRNDYSK